MSLLERLGTSTATSKLLLDNSPLLPMAGPEVLDDHQRLDQVPAVVLETTGDLSVLTREAAVDEALLAGVRGSERLR